jgi:hypothetical protein
MKPSSVGIVGARAVAAPAATDRLVVAVAALVVGLTALEAGSGPVCGAQATAAMLAPTSSNPVSTGRPEARALPPRLFLTGSPPSTASRANQPAIAGGQPPVNVDIMNMASLPRGVTHDGDLRQRRTGAVIIAEMLAPTQRR